MSETTPKAWLCKHCGERVDPTMELCWSCGRDRDGKLDPADFINQVDVDVTRCTACEYLLKGNTDATVCPECGEPVPWIECETCGVRGSRAEMIDGCPACKIADTGVTFDREVTRLGIAGPDGRCRQCEYDMRALPDAQSCPECGFKPDRETFETLHRVSSKSQSVSTGSPHSQGVSRRIVAILVVLLLGGCFVSVVTQIFYDSGQDAASSIFIMLWLVTLAILVIDLIVFAIHKPLNNSDSD